MEELSAPSPPEGLRQAHSAELVIPWIGAGLSNAVSNKNLPDYRELILTCLHAAQADGIVIQDADVIYADVQRKSYKTAAMLLRRQLQENEFTRIIRSRLQDDNPAPSLHHRILNLMEYRVYFTTNYDRVLDQILLPRPAVLTYRDHNTMRVIMDEQTQSVSQQVPYIFKLNGDVSAPPTIVLGQSSALGLYDRSTPLGLSLIHI